jgi:hypothetical protein
MVMGSVSSEDRAEAKRRWVAATWREHRELWAGLPAVGLGMLATPATAQQRAVQPLPEPTAGD